MANDEYAGPAARFLAGSRVAAPACDGRRRSQRPRRLSVCIAALAVVLVAAGVGCAPSPTDVLQVSTPRSPLFPAFDPSVSDYVTRCGEQASVNVAAPEGTLVSVDGHPAASGSFIVDVWWKGAGQAFTIVVDAPDQPTATYHVRCLPSDFPLFSASRSGSPQAEYYLTVPGAPLGQTHYSVIFDNRGVPIWWAPPVDAFFADLLSNGNIAVTPHVGGSVEERRLDGTLVRTITPTIGGLDGHDVQVMPNGNFLVVTSTVTTGFDLSSLCSGGVCFPSNAAVKDPVIQELTPDGALVWEWRASDHISPLETGPEHIGQLLVIGAPYDLYHWNSLEYTPTGLIVSFRNLDAVFKVDRATGDIVWKLGGTPRPESLAVQADPVAPGTVLGSQHDARILADGTLTVHDNATGLARAPREVRYEIDTTTSPGTATLVEQHSDPAIAGSLCCGSARKLPGGHWVTGWGGTDTITETTADGARVFELQFFPTVLVYRAVPILPGLLDRGELRAAMDTQFGDQGAGT